MTWLEFKQKVESEGVTDDTEIQYIDIGGGDKDSIEVNLDEPGKVLIWN